MMLISQIRRSFSIQITLWIVGFAAVIMLVILLLIAHFSHVVVSEEGDGRKLLMTALMTAVVSIAILSLFCWWTVRHYVRPLDLLAVSAQRITDGKIDESVPDTEQSDEIGQLQNSFAKMQRSLVGYIAEMNQKRDALSIQNLKLESAYQQARDADSIKTQFLSHMTTQMGKTVEDIDALTTQLCEHHAEISKPELMKTQIQMLSYTDTITHLLDQMLNGSNLNSSSHEPRIKTE